jgi:hypothetical protein
MVDDSPTVAPPTKLDRFHLWPDSEWVDQPIPAARVEDLIGEGDVVFLVGKPGTGKSFVALELAFRISAGEPFFGRTTRRGAVVYLAAEGGHGMKKRIKAWRDANPKSMGHIHVIPHALNFFQPPPRFARPVPAPDMTKLIERLDALGEPIALIVIDTLARSVTGAEENSSRDMSLFVAEIDRLRERFGCAVLVVHHVAKGDGEKSPRGSSALLGAVDACIEVVATDARSERTVTLKSLKTKDLPPFEPMKARLVPVEVTIGVRIEKTAVLRPIAGSTADDDPTMKSESPKEPMNPKEQEHRLNMLAQLACLGSATSTTWWKATGLSKATFQRYRKEFVEEHGSVVPHPADHARYILAPAWRDALARFRRADSAGTPEQ